MSDATALKADGNSPLTKLVSMLMRHRDLIDHAAGRDASAAAMVTHEGPRPEAIANLAERRHWAAKAGQIERRVWTQRDIRWHRHNAGTETYEPIRRAARLSYRFSRGEVLQAYRDANLEAVRDGRAAVVAPLLRRAMDAHEAMLVEAREDRPQFDLFEINDSISKLIDETKPPGTSQSRLNDQEKAILEAIALLNDGGIDAPTNQAIADWAGYSVQKVKETTGAMYRHYLLDKGPNGVGFTIAGK